jgi:hydrogenase/urease accessory protein HupE
MGYAKKDVGQARDVVVAQDIPQAEPTNIASVTAFGLFIGLEVPGALRIRTPEVIPSSSSFRI